MRKSILVLDDCPFMLKVISELLKSFDYEVTATTDGKEALRKVISTRFDLIITDMNMPEMDGLEFTRQVRSCPGCRFLPIIMVSSQKDEEKISIAKKMGVSTFLSKPIKEEQLKSILEIILNKRMTPRIPINMKVFYRKHGSTSDFMPSYTLNVSLGGMFLETGKPLSPGDKLDLKLALDGKNSPLPCQGRVAWVSGHPPGMGLTFLELDEHQLQEFIHSGTWKYRT